MADARELNEAMTQQLVEALMIVHNGREELTLHVAQLSGRELLELVVASVSFSYGLLKGMASTTGEDMETEVLPGVAEGLWQQHYDQYPR